MYSLKLEWKGILATWKQWIPLSLEGRQSTALPQGEVPHYKCNSYVLLRKLFPSENVRILHCSTQQNLWHLGSAPVKGSQQTTNLTQRFIGKEKSRMVVALGWEATATWTGYRDYEGFHERLELSGMAWIDEF